MAALAGLAARRPGLSMSRRRSDRLGRRRAPGRNQWPAGRSASATQTGTRPGPGIGGFDGLSVLEPGPRTRGPARPSGPHAALVAQPAPPYSAATKMLIPTGGAASTLAEVPLFVLKMGQCLLAQF